MLRRAYLIIMIEMYIFMVRLTKPNLNIFLENSSILNLNSFGSIMQIVEPQPNVEYVRRECHM